LVQYQVIIIKAVSQFVSYRDRYSYLPIAVCNTNCDEYDQTFSACNTQSTCDYCSSGYEVTITCYGYNYDDWRPYNNYDDDDDGYDDSSDSSFSSAGAVVGTTIGGLSICGIIVLVVICRIYVRHSLTRQRNNRTYIVTQRRPRILIARVTRTTAAPSGPPPPPPYTPTQPTSDYTPVPPRGYQPVHTDDYTTTPAAPSSDVPSEPPPEYTPSVSTDTVPLVTQDTVQ